MILESSPPNSIVTSVCGIIFEMAFVDATTSWTNSAPKSLCAIRPPEPVIAIVVESYLNFL